MSNPGSAGDSDMQTPSSQAPAAADQPPHIPASVGEGDSPTESPASAPDSQAPAAADQPPHTPASVGEGDSPTESPASAPDSQPRAESNPAVAEDQPAAPELQQNHRPVGTIRPQRMLRLLGTGVARPARPDPSTRETQRQFAARLINYLQRAFPSAFSPQQNESNTLNVAQGSVGGTAAGPVNNGAAIPSYHYVVCVDSGYLRNPATVATASDRLELMVANTVAVFRTRRYERERDGRSTINAVAPEGQNATQEHPIPDTEQVPTSRYDNDCHMEVEETEAQAVENENVEEWDNGPNVAPIQDKQQMDEGQEADSQPDVFQADEEEATTDEEESTTDDDSEYFYVKMH